MKKKGITLAAGAVVLGCLFGTYFALKSHNEKISEEALTESETEPILSINTDEITSLSFQAGSTPVTFLREGDDWALEGDETFPVSSSSLSSVLSCLAPLESSRTLTGVSDLSEYGLNNPQNTVTFTDQAGKETTVTIGDTNSSTGDDYIMVDQDSSTIYTASASLRESLSPDLYTYAVSEELPVISAADMIGVTVSRPVGGYRIGLSGNKTWQVTDLTDAAKADGSGSADQDTVNSAFSSLAASIYYSDYLEHNCTDPSSYGIGENGTTFTILYEEEVSEAEAEGQSESEEPTEKIQKTLTFHIGSADDYGNYYVQKEGSTQVHTLSASTLSPFLDVTAADWEASEEEEETEAES